MIIGTITVVRCDGKDCDVWRSYNDTEEAAFQHEWFAGLELHFCANCRGRVDNADAIRKEEQRLDELTKQVRRRVTGGHSRRPHVH